MTITTPAGYEHLDTTSVRRWIAALPTLNSHLGGSAEEWRVSEVSDGNLNSVYIVTGPTGGICVKQSLPFVRVVGESWPMPLERTYFEQLYFQTSAPYARGSTPALFHYDPEQFAIAMESLAEHIVLRRGLVNGQRYPSAARHVAEYVARRAFSTSVLNDSFERVNERIGAFLQNTALTRITVDLIFTHPFIENERNRWTTPQLDDLVRDIRCDAELKSSIARIAHRFLTVHEALIHGDLHTGSVMATATDTRVIDAEFATYGPIGFDLGLFIGNLLTAYFSQPGHEAEAGERREYGEWILEQIGEFWSGFSAQFELLWQARRTSDGYPSAFFASQSDAHSFALERQRWFRALFTDTIGYAGAEIIRRTIGFAHNFEFESISDEGVRARLEQCAIEFARELIVSPHEFCNAGDVIEGARRRAGRVIKQ